MNLGKMRLTDAGMGALMSWPVRAAVAGVLILVLARLYPGVPNPGTGGAEVASHDEVPAASLSQSRDSFIYVSDRDETLGEFKARFALRGSLDPICRDLGIASGKGDTKTCAPRALAHRIKTGDRVKVYRDMLHTR